MPESLPLYPAAPLAAVENPSTTGQEVNPQCRRCGGYEGTKTVCMTADGEPGGLLVVGSMPGREEDLVGRPNVGRSGQLVRRLVEAHWKGPVAHDNALRCYGAAGLEEPKKAVPLCRGYLSRTFRECVPTRVVALGDLAMEAVLGRSVPSLSVRRGYGWIYGVGSSPVPVFLVMHPTAATKNRFLRLRFEEDLRWALTTPTPAAPAWDGETWVVQTAEEAESAAADLRAKAWVSVDAEWAGVMFEDDFTVLCVGCHGRGDRHVWQWDEAALTDPDVRAPLASLLSDPRVPKVGQNVKSDANAVWAAHGIELRGLKVDTMLVRSMLESDALRGLDTLGELCGMGGHKDEAVAAVDEAIALIRKARRTAEVGDKLPSLFPVIENQWVDAAVRLGGDPRRFAYGLIPRKTLLAYNARDCVATSGVAETQLEQLVEQPDIARAWETVVRPSSWAAAQIERWGIAASLPALKQFETLVTQKKAEAQKRLDAYGVGFNGGSSKQVAALLYDRLRLPCLEYTKKGAPSTDASALEKLKGRHPAVDAILAYRKSDKLLGTYAVGLQQYVRSDGRIHANINLDGARSGRTSMDDPNLQNLPSEKKDEVYGKMARDCFVASPGHKLLSADYSQLELRVAAMLSGDDVMTDFFRRGVDIHQGSAMLCSQMIWGIPPEAVTKEHRAKIKPINFGILYGKGDQTLAEELHSTVEEAQKIREAIFGKFRKLRAWIDDCTAEAQRTGYTWTWWDGRRARRRDMFRLADPDDAVRSRAQNGSYNSPIQGTASDFCTMSATAVSQWIVENGVPAMLVAIVHDQLLLDVREDCVDEVALEVRRIMRGWNSLGVPLEVDLETGEAWGSLGKYSLPKSV